MKAFELDSQPTVPYTKSNITGKICSGEYITNDIVEIKPFNQVEFATAKADSLTKVEVIDCDRVFYGILTAIIKSNKKKGTINIKVKVHIYTEEQSRDEKFDNVSNGAFEKQFLNL